jgi:hypothetical protein
MYATSIGLIATGFDLTAFIINFAFGIGTAVAGLVTGPPGYLAVAALYNIASPIPNIFGTYGGLLWTLQGMVLGDTYASFSGTISPELFSNNVSASVTFSQDTLVSALLDGGGWLIREPITAALVSEIGVGYDILRNPLSPAFTSIPPVIPSLINPTYTYSIDLSSPIPISSGWTLFP